MTPTANSNRLNKGAAPETRPLVSIFVPVFNGARYLENTLRSLQAQTYTNLEILVVDDGSTDDSAAITNSASHVDPRIRLIQHDRNYGLPNARNTGVRSVSADARYIMNHDSDDISHANKLERLVDYLEKNPDVAAVGSFCHYFGNAGQDRGSPALEWQPDRIRDTFHIENSMAVSATLIRRETFTQVGLFNPTFIGCDDYDFWTRCLMHGLILANIPEELHFIRLHDTSLGSTRGVTMQEESHRIRAMYRAFRGDSCLSSKSLAEPTAGNSSTTDIPRLLGDVRVAVTENDIPTALRRIGAALILEPRNPEILAIQRRLREFLSP